MSLARHAKRRDANEGEVIEALEAVGAVVYRLDRPVDLLVDFRKTWFVLEVKRPEGTVGDHQREFMATCRARGVPAAIVRSADEALCAIGAIYSV